MITLVFYYLILPFLLFGLVLKFIRRYGSTGIPPEIEKAIHEDPIERKYFRAVRLDGRFGKPNASLMKIGDFETLNEAVDAAFEARKAFSAPNGGSSSFLVVNDRGEVLQDV